ncbi:MAG: CHAT domain-containing protein, partial [Acidobacteriota bacterium]
ELHSPNGRVPFTRHRVGESVALGATTLAEYAERKLVAFQALDSPAHVTRKLPGGLHRELSALGKELYRELFPEPLRAAYEGVRDDVRSLLILSEEPWIPWELVKPHGDDFEQDFLCCQHEVVRWLTGKTTPAPGFGADLLGARRLAYVEAGEVPKQRALEHLDRERGIFEGLAARHGSLEAKILRRARFHGVDSLLSEGGFGVLHFAGHGWFDARDPGSALLRLSDGESLRPRDLYGAIEGRMRRDRPLVFFNSCQAARQERLVTGLGGWARTLVLDCGCGAFLGPLWDIDDGQAAAFASAFYGALEDGSTVGAAVRRARLATREQFPEGTGWLAYSVFAHPGARLRLGQPSTPLWIPAARWRADVSPPGALLRAEYDVVPFHGRRRELEDLAAWRGDPRPLAVRLYTGVGGIGKTRLALEACRRARADGWGAGFFLDGGDAKDAEAQVEALLDRGGPVLAVIDYAERRRGLLRLLVRRLLGTERGKVRLLLLSRADDWWQAVQREGGGVGDVLSGPAAECWALRPLALGLDDRRASYRLARTAFAETLGAQPEDGDDGIPDLGAEVYDRALYIHMQALAAVEGRPLEERDDLLDHVLRRERRFWEKLAAERGVPGELVPGFGRGMAAFNLVGGARDETEAVEILGRLKVFADQPWAVRAQVARILHDTYPGDRWIQPVLPDLLGEHLTRRELQRDAAELLALAAPTPPGV